MAVKANGGVPVRRVLVVDDHGVVRIGLVALLNRQPDIEVVGEAENADEALSRVAALRPDVVVMDVRMPGMDGIGACREIVRRHPGTAVILLTAFAEKRAMVEAMLGGARGYILKNLENDALIQAVRTVAGGGTAVDPSLAESVMAELARAATPAAFPAPLAPDAPAAPLPATPAAPGATSPGGAALAGLNAQERAILKLMARGRTNREIAEALFFSEKTIRNYVSGVFAKLGLRNRAEAAVFAAQHGLMDD